MHLLLISVNSSTLATVHYDHARQLLRLEFRSHAVYLYFGLPPHLYHGLLAADSKGSYFNQNIRGRFPYQKLADEENSRQAETSGNPSTLSTKAR